MLSLAERAAERLGPDAFGSVEATQSPRPLEEVNQSPRSLKVARARPKINFRLFAATASFVLAVATMIFVTASVEQRLNRLDTELDAVSRRLSGEIGALPSKLPVRGNETTARLEERLDHLAVEFGVLSHQISGELQELRTRSLAHTGDIGTEIALRLSPASASLVATPRSSPLPTAQLPSELPTVLRPR